MTTKQHMMLILSLFSVHEVKMGESLLLIKLGNQDSYTFSVLLIMLHVESNG